jgi:collagen type I/II/III/V/XI/XXIV/XXVII alpha
VAAGTFGPAKPNRNLTLSPSHAVYVNGELIPIGRLINGTSIIQIPMDEITYYHVELAEHDLLLAEGVLAESYLDVGDRSNFGNVGGEIRLFPDFANCLPDVAMAWETRGCAPLLLCGPRLERTREWISALADAAPLAAAAWFREANANLG